MTNKKRRWARKPTFEGVVGCDRGGRIVPSWLRLGSGFTKANDLFAGLVLTAFLKQFDAFEALENVALSGDGAGSFEAAVLRHKSVKLSGGDYDKRTGWEGEKASERRNRRAASCEDLDESGSEALLSVRAFVKCLFKLGNGSNQIVEIWRFTEKHRAEHRLMIRFPIAEVISRRH